MKNSDPVYVLGPGGQYNHMICRRVAELGYRVSLRALDIDLGREPRGLALIIGGGPGSLAALERESEEKKARLLGFIRELDLPTLGICYGHQLIAWACGGEVRHALRPEFGPVEVTVVREDPLFKGVPSSFTAWLSHNDEVIRLPPDFVILAESPRTMVQAFRHESRALYGVQFHAEVEHTNYGREILGNFLQIAEAANQKS
jgi:GMP synthase (glutamine-hydrolysing)